MKRRIFSLLALVLVLATALSSCSLFSGSFESVVNVDKMIEVDPAKSSVSQIPTTGSPEKWAGDLVCFKDTTGSFGDNSYTVYNLKTGRNVISKADSKSSVTVGSEATDTRISYSVELGYNYYTEHSWIVVAENTTVTTYNPISTDTTVRYYVYDENGTKSGEFVSDNGITLTTESVADLIYVGDKVYRISDEGSISRISFGEFAKTPRVSRKVADYYYAEADGLIKVYDSDLKLSCFYQVYPDAEDFVWQVLNNGNVLIQYTYYEGEYAEEYDYIDEGERYSYYSYLLTAKNGKVKELKLDVLLADGILRRDDYDEGEWGYDEDIENIAYAVAIEDGKLVTTQSIDRLVTVSNKGKVKQLKAVIDNQGARLPSMVANNRWVVSDVVGNCYLLNEEGEILDDVTGIKSYYNGSTEYFVHDNTIYDWNLNAKYDLEANNASVACGFEKSMLIKKNNGEVLLLTNGTTKSVISAFETETVSLLSYDSNGIYVLATNNGYNSYTYTVYNEEGRQLTVIDGMNVSLNSSCVVNSTESGVVVICGRDKATGNNVYYRVS